MDVRKIRLDEGGKTQTSEARDEYEKDYARLVQSPAFRRLQGKSQVFGAGTGDYYRTRLTHSLEVSQIARESARRLHRSYPMLRKPEHPGLMMEPEVVECAALAHDLGHPPFGHKGEEVLHRLLSKRGMPYEGNAQNFRILMFLEKRAGSDSGLDLTAAVLLAINKYPHCLNEPGVAKGVYEMEWEGGIRKLRELWGMPKGRATLEAQLMDLCDDIAYSTHDIEDGIRAGKILMSPGFFEDDRLAELIVQEIENDPSGPNRAWDGIGRERKTAMVKRVLADYYEQWTAVFREAGREPSRTRREMKARWVGLFASRVGILDDGEGWKRVSFVREGAEDMELLRTMEILKKLAWVTLIKDFRVQRLQKRSEIMLTRLWEAFSDRETGKLLLPPDWVESYERQQGSWPWERLAADYIAGMTDAYAEKVYTELFASRSGSIYERD